MFTSRLVTLAFVLVFAIVNVMAMPLPLQLRVGLAGASPRDLAPFTPIRAYMKRDGMWKSDYGRRDPVDVPEQDAATAPDGDVQFFNPADPNARRDILEQDPSKTDPNLDVVAFKRVPHDTSFAVENAI